MAELATLARPYARAVYELAHEEKKLAGWSGLLAGLADAVQDPKVSQWIGHPALGRGQLADVLIKAMGDAASDRGKNLVRLLSEYDRLTLVPEIARLYEVLRAEAENRIDVEVVSAAPVDGTQQKDIAVALQKKLDRDVSVEWKTDPELIAGAVVRAGDLVIDGSFTAELEQLRAALTQ